jgi:hypothetical protein
MKLTELDPHWTCDTLGRHGQGLSFECPVHRDHRLAVPFANPVDGGEKMTSKRNFWWQRTGETFDTMTLGPSIDASGNQADVGGPNGLNVGMIQTPCWHGFITKGEVT